MDDKLPLITCSARAVSLACIDKRENATYAQAIRHSLTRQVVKLLKEPPQARRGIDYLVAIYYAATPARQQEQFDEILQLADEIAPNWAFKEAGNSPHFECVFTNDVGIRIELTPPTSISGRNKGGMCVSFPGTCWWIQTSEQGAFNVLRLSKIEGFKHFSRIDFQNTELEPEWPAERMGQAVNDGEIWVKGSTRFRDHWDRDQEGEPINGITLYWNSVRSEKQSKSYNKAADAGWAIAAVRDETQLRGKWAHAHGKELITGLTNSHTSAEMAGVVESQTCSALRQHLEYWTLNGTSPKTDKNWKRNANPADWYVKRIGKASERIQKAPKPLQDLQTTVDYGVQQYGRYIYRWCIENSRRNGIPLDMAVAQFMTRCQSRLKEDDDAWLFDEQTKGDIRAIKKELKQAADQVAYAQEHGWWPE